MGMGILVVTLLGLPPAGELMGQTVPPIRLGSPSAVLMDGVTGQILLEKNPEERRSPASLTKVMTLHLAFDALKRGDIKLEQEETVSKKAWKMGGSQMFLEVGDRVKFVDLITGVATISANDGALAIAEFLSGSQDAFVHRMNQKAEALGLKHTHFANAHGLHNEGQETSAIDMAHLGFYYINEHPEALEYHKMSTYTYGGITQKNWNPLLDRGVGVDGLKTGYLARSGYHILFSALQDGQRLVGAVMGAETPDVRDTDAMELIRYGFKNFSTRTLVKEGDIVETVKVPQGDPPELGLSAAKSLVVTVRKDREESLPIRKEMTPTVDPPIAQGSVLGKLILEGEGFTRKEIDLVASQAVQVRSYFSYYMVAAALVAAFLFFLFWRRRGFRKRRS